MSVSYTHQCPERIYFKRQKNSFKFVARGFDHLGLFESVHTPMTLLEKSPVLSGGSEGGRMVSLVQFYVLPSQSREDNRLRVQ